MMKNPFFKIALSSLLGLVICGIALTAGVWETGPRLTAIDLWLSLRMTLINSPQGLPGAVRQQVIFGWLSMIIAGFALQVIVTIAAFNWRKILGWAISAVIWGITLASTLVLLISFHAMVSGVMWLAFGSAVALFSELWWIFGEISAQHSDPSKEMSRIEQRWSSILDEAQKQEQCFSILAVHANPPVSYEELQKLQTELRGRDMIYPVQNGLFVLLWEISPEYTLRLANKLQNVLQGYSTRQVQVGSASFPKDAENLKTLLSRASQALESARQIGGSAVVPFSLPASKDARSVLSSWEALLEEAAVAQTPVVLMFFKTSQPLSLTEHYSIQKELRGRDVVTVFENGFYVFLWNSTGEGGKIVASKLQRILSTAKIQSSPRMALFPQDGSSLDALLAVVSKDNL